MAMEAELDTADASTLVSMRWILVPAEPGAPLPLDAPVPIELLGFGGALVTEVELEGMGRVVLWPTHGTHRAATLRPPFDGLSGAGVAADGAVPVGGGPIPSLRLALTYRASSVLESDGRAVRVRIPVLTGPPMAGGEPGGVDVVALEAAGLGPVGFAATVDAPEAWRISDGFPTGLARGADGLLRAELPVAPAMVGLRARTDGGWSPGLPLLVDLVALSVLLAFAGAGWLHLRGVVASRRGPAAAVGSGGSA